MRRRLDSDFFDPPKPRVIAHRGSSGDFPENTMRAFRAAAELGAPYIELDIHLTRDGEVVVCHDDNLERIAGRGGVIREMRSAELARADAGFSFERGGRFPFRGQGLGVPTLREVLGGLPERRFVIEVKQVEPSLSAALFEVLRETEMTRRVLIASEHQRPLDEIRALAPALPTSFSGAEVAQFMLSLPPGAPAYEPHGDALQIPPEHLGWKLVTPASVAAAHRLGVEVHVWTVNEPAEMRGLIAMGADGILTDYPGRMIELMKAA